MAKPDQPRKTPGVPLNLRIDPALKKRFKLWCVEHDAEMTEAVTHWITLGVAGKLPPPPEGKPGQQQQPRGRQR